MRQQQGSAAIEFGLVAATFLALVFAILETAIVFFAGQALETAAADSARLIMTGQAQTQNLDASRFKNAVCAKIYGLFDCQNGESQAVGIDRKVTLTSRTVADLASQVSTIARSDMSNILNASSAVISPYDSGQLKVTVSQIAMDANGNATVSWSCTKGGTAHAISSSASVPAALKIANTSLIWGEAAYSYKPTIGYVVTGTLNLSNQIYMRPRLSDSITASC